MNRLLPLLIVIGLLIGCATAAPTSSGVEVPSVSPSLPKQDAENTPAVRPGFISSYCYAQVNG